MATLASTNLISKMYKPNTKKFPQLKLNVPEPIYTYDQKEKIEMFMQVTTYRKSLITNTTR